MKEAQRNGLICCSIVGVLLIVILVPITFGYVEYWQYGLVQRRSTGSIDFDKGVYGRGRHNIGPDRRFITYQADAHSESFEEFSVFSAGSSNESVGLEFEIDLDFTYLLIEDEIPQLHQELAQSYREVIASRAKDAIRNRATSVTFTQYFQDRKQVERMFRDAVETRWNEKPSLHCTLDQFHLARIQIPTSVAEKQLQNQVQNELNDKEEYLQLAQVEREETKVQVNRIILEKGKVLRTSQAEASLLRSQARAEAERIQKEAQLLGTQLVYQAAGISTQEHMAAFTYIRTLKQRQSLNLDLVYYGKEDVVPITTV